VIADDLRNRYIAGEIPMLLDCATYFAFKNTFVIDSDGVKERLINNVENNKLLERMM